MYGVVSIYPIRIFKNLLKNRLFATDFVPPRFFLALLVVYSLSAQNALYAKEMSFLVLPFLFTCELNFILKTFAKALSLHHKDYSFLFS